jgi:hypothetical protein
MTFREQITTNLDDLNEDQLQQVDLFVKFLRFQTFRKLTQPMSDDIARLYTITAAEDADLAEEGMQDYSANLLREDTR